MSVKDNQLVIRSEDYNDSIITEKINWNDLKWIQFKRVGDEAFFYDGILLGSYYLTFISCIVTVAAFHDQFQSSSSNGSGIGASSILGFTLCIALPINLVLAKARFSEFNPENYAIESEKK
jgi:hypothetical protein